MNEFVLEVVEGPHAGLQIPLGDRPLSIGREPGNDLELADDDLVSRRHARLTPTDRGAVVEDLNSSNGTFVFGNEIHSPAPIGPGSQLTIGVSLLELRTVAAAAAATAVRPIPAGLAATREVPVVAGEHRAAAPGGGGLATPERAPDYVTPVGSRNNSPLLPLLDVHTKRMARTAPLAVLAIVCLIVIVALSLR